MAKGTKLSTKQMKMIMNYVKILSFTFLFTVVFSTVIWAQSDYFNQFKDPIETQLEQSLNRAYTLEQVYEVNEFVGSTRVSTYPLDVPYGTLSDYVLFAARNETTNWVFGLFKNGAVEWHTPEALQCSDIKVYGSMDLNLDGQVDIMVNCALFGRDNFRGFMYIYSWNGIQAELISHIENTQGGAQNTIETYEADSFGVLDLNGDGIMEIRGLDRDDPDQRSYWSWNGSAYGNWSTTPSPPSEGFYPADMAEGEVEAQIAKTDTGFTYQYTIISSPSSKRRITELFIDHGKPEKVGNPPMGWRFNGVGLSKYPFNWKYDGDNTKFMISPGDSLSEFELYSNTPPRVYNSYIRSEHKLPDYNIAFSVEKYLIDIRTNSHKGITLAPGPDLTGFNNNQLTDSLYNFLGRSCSELGWATDSTVCGQLEQQVNDVGDFLSAQDTVQAANALKEFIDLVEAEKDASLTSEGYALLYYNAQYLAARLPEPGPASGITCGCNNPVTQSSGTITIRNGETKCLNTSFSGSVFFESGGTLNVCSTASLQNIYGNQPGQINVSESGDVTVGNWNNNYAEDGLTNWGTTVFSNQATVNNGSLTNHGGMMVNGGLNQNNGLITNHGQLEVGNDLNINTSGNANTGSLTVEGRFTLNSGSFQNECHMQAGSFMINGLLDNSAGSSVISGGQLTLNSSGEIMLAGGKAMLSVGSAMLNGTVTSEGENLFVSQNMINYNSGASINAAGQPLYVVAPNLSSLTQDFAVADGSVLVIPATTCNPQGYNVSGN
ncbi:hypothetical protein [Gracilimonas sp.]|uniref:FIMAH domain-containing protein n=1 Tax=Gracilimonas sp. TaxID=1974203 RepID=UPI0032F058A8